MSESILIVDDEMKIRTVLQIFLEKEGYQIDEASNGKEALDMVKHKSYNLILLDVMMPGIEGWTVCREIRKTMDTPIVMLTARSEEYDKLFGFEMGADDYITKPFSLKEVAYRIKAILRRGINHVKTENTNTLVLGNLKINDLEKQAYLDQSEMTLTPKEYEMTSHKL